MSQMIIVAGTFDTFEDIVGWALVALLMIPIALLIALPFLAVASRSSGSSPGRIFRFIMGGGFAAIGIATGHWLYWRATNDIPAIVWYVTGGLVGAIIGTIIAAIFLLALAAICERLPRIFVGTPDKSTCPCGQPKPPITRV
ncbi:MAG: hypothetical protein KF752_10020 [Pirellulaceae bacterium]|nr:hypothetical protein [Pirellulaceae bacterium]